MLTESRRDEIKKATPFDSGAKPRIHTGIKGIDKRLSVYPFCSITMQRWMALMLLAFGNSAEGMVNFTGSAIYDEIDLSARQVDLNCDTGCYVYASILSSTPVFYDGIQFLDKSSGHSFGDLPTMARKYDDTTGAKKPLTLPAGGKYAIMNSNTANPSSAVVVYVLSAAFIQQANAPLPYIYEPLHKQIGSTLSNTVTILSASPFTLTTAQLSEIDQLQAVATGPDVFMGSDQNGVYRLYSEKSKNHENMLLPIRGPILTIKTEQQRLINWTVDPTIEYNNHIVKDGMITAITSWGYTGFVNNNVYRWRTRQNILNEEYSMKDFSYFNVMEKITYNTAAVVNTWTDAQNQTFGERSPLVLHSEASINGYWLRVAYQGGLDDYFAIRMTFKSTPPPPTGTTSIPATTQSSPSTHGFITFLIVALLTTL